MKLTKEQIQALFQKLGIAEAVEIVNSAEEVDTTFNADEKLNEYIQSKEPVFLAKFNESILPDKIKEVAGEFGGKLNGYIRKASNNQIPLADLQNLSDSEKISKLVEILDANKGKDSEDLRNLLKKTNEEYTSEIERIKSEHETELLNSNNRLNDYKISDYLATKVLPEIPLVDGDAKIRTELLKTALSAQYNLVLNDKNEVEIRKMDNIESPVIVKDNTFLTPKDFASEYFTGIGIVKTDNRHDETRSDKGNQAPSNATSFSNAGIDKTTEDSLASL
ncbi:hypothetical protein [Empedobacter sp.]|uniref:hypothetical protein n=1 Tax=Empedobacter sp. TaxID=1927715 RepID=UPI0028964277|nr:hypothetical protein [Empedobacter sp.]